MVTADYIVNGLMQRGLPEHVARGFAINMQDESGLNPGINEIAPLVPGSRGGFGLYQLTGPRRKAYEAFAAQRGADPADPDAQLDFLMTELQGPEARAAKSILGAKDVSGAATAIARDFLRPAPENLQKRVAKYGGAGGAQMQPTVSTQGSMGSAAPMQAEEQPKWKNPDLWANLAIAFNSMRMRPDEGLAQAMRSGIESRASARKAAQQKSRTVDALRQIGADPKLIQLAEAGYGAEALKAAMQKPKARSGVEVGGKLVDPVTGQVIYEDTSAPSYDAKDVATARKEFTSLPQVKDFAQQTSAYGRILASAKDPSAAGDLALIFNYMKVLDPGSTVREGEFATAQNAGGVDQRVVSLYNSLINGERLSPAQRSDFADRATRLYQNAEQQYSNIATQYSGFAEAAGLPVEQVIPDFGYSGQLYQTPLEFRRPPAPEGISEQDWKTAWDNMTDEQRGQFLNGGQ